jgi:hypothetical protein
MMKNRQFYATGTAMMLMGSVLFTGCGQKAASKTAKEEKTTEEETIEEAEPEVDPATIFPRTKDGKIQSVIDGTYIDEEKANTRPFAIMIENTHACTPQYGLNEAGVIYECPVEGGITRYMAIWQKPDDFDRIGNIRSCRPYYVWLAAEWNGVYVHYGQSFQGQAALDTGIVDDLNGLSSLSNLVFYRSSDRKAPHNAYTSTKGMMDGVEAKSLDMSYDQDQYIHWNYSDPDGDPFVPEGDNVSDVQVLDLYYYDNDPYFIYDPETGDYTRYEFGEKQIDKITGEDVTVKNIIIKNADNGYYDDEHYRVKLALVGANGGELLTQGKRMPISWSKEKDSSVTHYYDMYGNLITLNPGRTWVCVQEASNCEETKEYATLEEYQGK